MEIETVKEVSQGYLTSLWNQDVFRKEGHSGMDRITNQYSQRFTKLVVGVAVAAAGYWLVANPAIALKAFTSVLIVACPCALALAAPFALGYAQRALARRKVYLKNSSVLETLARVDAVVFDKTGTLTASGAGSIKWFACPGLERDAVEPTGVPRPCSRKPASRNPSFIGYPALAGQSSHPLAVRVARAIADGTEPVTVRSFVETPGCGMEGTVGGHTILFGSASWLQSRGIAAAEFREANGSGVHVVIDGRYRGAYVLSLRGASGYCGTRKQTFTAMRAGAAQWRQRIGAREVCGGVRRERAAAF